MKRGDLTGALAVFTKAAVIGPPFPEIYVSLGQVQALLHQDAAALQSLRQALGLDPRLSYARFRIWLIRARQGEQAEATQELRAQLAARPADPGQAWALCVGRFLTGDSAETNFLLQAVETAKRPTDTLGQLCEARYYAGMKRLIDGDKAGARELLKQCEATRADNFIEYTSALVELRELNQQ
jgi:lipoprotein NlpI